MWRFWARLIKKKPKQPNFFNTKKKKKIQNRPKTPFCFRTQKVKTMHPLPDFHNITTFVFDVDGVLTDGTLLCFSTGEQARAFNIKDGYAIRHAIQNGYRVVIISGRNEPGVRKRLESLDVKDIFLGSTDKLDTFQNFIYMNSIDPQEVVFMGDDMPDLEVMQHCGISACPADAAIDICDISQYVASAEGGKGAVRELIEMVMKLQQTW